MRVRDNLVKTDCHLLSSFDSQYSMYTMIIMYVTEAAKMHSIDKEKSQMIDKLLNHYF